MNSRGVVIVYRAVNFRHQSAEGWGTVRIAKIELKLPIEAFLVPVLPRTARMRAGDEDAKAREHINECGCVVFFSVVTVKDQGVRMIQERVPQCLYCELCSLAERHRDADNLTRMEINHRGDVDPPRLEPYLGKISGPDVVWIHRDRRRQQVGVEVKILCFSVLFRSSPSSRFDPKLLHHPLDALPVDTEELGDPSVAVCRMFPQCLLNYSPENPVGFLLL